jgi:hypothetical protein
MATVAVGHNWRTAILPLAFGDGCTGLSEGKKPGLAEGNPGKRLRSREYHWRLASWLAQPLRPASRQWQPAR